MTDDVTLRPAERRDMTELDALFVRCYSRLLAADYPPSTLILAVPLFAKARPELVSSGHYYVVEDANGAIVGAGGWSMQSPDGRAGQRGVGHVRHMAVDPDRARGGVGRLILSHTMMVAKGSGMSMLQAMSTRTAVPFYAAMGFEARGERALSLTGGVQFPVELMVALL